MSDLGLLDALERVDQELQRIKHNIEVKFKKLHKDAVIPVYELEGDACCSLRVVEDYKVGPGSRCLLSTGFAIQLPKNFEAQIRSRSGLAHKQGLVVTNSPGTIDECYRGEIKVSVLNTSGGVIYINKGDAVAQMKFAPYYVASFEEVEELDDSNRGTGGFGSTGK